MFILGLLKEQSQEIKDRDHKEVYVQYVCIYIHAYVQYVCLFSHVYVQHVCMYIYVYMYN